MVLFEFTSFEEFVMVFQLNSATSGSAIMNFIASADDIKKNPSSVITPESLKTVQYLGMSTVVSNTLGGETTTSAS